MLWSGREIQTTWPDGIGSPSVGAGSRSPWTTTLGAELDPSAGADTTRNSAFES